MSEGAGGVADRAVAFLDGPDAPTRLGLAVSGGGDSMALLLLVAPAAQARGIPVFVATVDHHLRPEARDEALMVAQCCQRLGVPHEILDWTGWQGQGNLQDAARDARRQLLTDWAERHDLDAIALGHTLDDQAETVLMRLARGSGVDGLAAMASDRREAGLRWLRPLLSERRGELRDLLRAQRQSWAEDPSNEDRGYARIRARDAFAALAPLGLTPEGLSRTAERMTLAKDALDYLAAEVSRQSVSLRSGAVAFDLVRLHAAPAETRLRLVSAAIRWVGGEIYRPRLTALRTALDEAAEGRRRTLAGTILLRRRDTLWLCRELKAANGPVATVDLWDRRWRLDGPHAPGLVAAALGPDGLAQCPDWRNQKDPRDALLTTPGIWRGTELVAAPCAGRPAGWSAQIVADFPYPAVPH